MSTTPSTSPSAIDDMAALAQTELNKSLNEAANKRLAIAVAQTLVGLGVLGAILIFVPFDPSGFTHLLIPIILLGVAIFCSGAVFHGFLKITREPKFAAAVKKYYMQFYKGLSIQQVEAEAGLA